MEKIPSLCSDYGKYNNVNMDNTRQQRSDRERPLKVAPLLAASYSLLIEAYTFLDTNLITRLIVNP